MALGFSACGALIIGFNQWAQVDGRRLVVLRVAGVVLLALVMMAFLPWPHAAMFYAVAAMMGLGLAYSDMLLFDAAAAHGGRLTALYVPIKMLVGFMLWVVADPVSVWPLWLEPWRGAAVAAGFVLCGGALLSLRRIDASWEALTAVLPVALLLAVGDVVAKDALEPVGQGPAWQEVCGRAVVFLLTTSLSGALLMAVAGVRFRPHRGEVVKGVLLGLILLPSLCLFLVTLAWAPNPGYVAAISMLSALWLALWGYFRRGEHNNWWAGLAMIAGALVVGLAGR